MNPWVECFVLIGGWVLALSIGACIVECHEQFKLMRRVQREVRNRRGNR